MSPSKHSIPFQRLQTLALVLLVGTAARVQAQTHVYDDFTSGLLSPIKWRAQQLGTGVLETARQLEGEKLVLRHRVLGNHQLTSGVNTSRNQLFFNTFPAQRFTSLRLRVRIDAVTVVGCPDGDASRAYVGVFSTLFTDTEGDRIGVFLLIDRQSTSREPPEVLHVRAGLGRCPGGDCTQGVHEVEEDLGPVLLGQQVTLRMAWQGREIRFRRDTEPSVTIRAPHDVATPLAGRTLEVSGFAANCPSMPATEAALTARIDKLFLAP